MLDRLLRLLGANDRRKTGGYASDGTSRPRDMYACAIDVDVSTDDPPEAVRVLQAGDYQSHPDGPHTVTREHLEEMAERFEELSTDLLVDVDHSSVFGGETRAAGWSMALELRDDGLYATWPEWTPLGEQLVTDREYRYLSPVYKLRTTRKDGSDGGALLHSIALTNTPYFNEGETSHVSAEHTPTQDAPTPMNREDLIEALGLEDDATDADIVEALEGAMEAFMSGEEGEDGDDNAGRASSTSRSADNEDDDDAPVLDGADPDALQSYVNSAVDRALSQRDNEQAIETLVDQAVSDGKIEPAERPIYLNSARRDFDKTKERLDALEQGRVLDGKMKTSSASRTRPLSVTGQSKAADYVRSQMQ